MIFISFSQIIGISAAKRDECALTNCLKIQLSLMCPNSNYQSNEVTEKWKDQVVEAGIPGDKCVTIFVNTWSDEQMNRWKTFIEYHVARKR